MGCLSLCETKKIEENNIEEPKFENHDEDNDDEDEDDNIQILGESIQRTEKNKTRIPKNVIIKDDDLIIKQILKNKKNKVIKTNKEFILDELKNEDNNDFNNKEKLRKAKNNWEYLMHRLITRKIDILREIIKREKKEMGNEEE